MQSLLDLTNDAFEEQFSNCCFNASLFSHEAHLRLAFIHIKKYGVEQAIVNVCAQLRAFTKQVGAEDKFNTTLTVAAVRAVHHFMGRCRAEKFELLIHEFPKLKYSFKELINYHYSADIFNSALAKREYLEPDLLPFN